MTRMDRTDRNPGIDLFCIKPLAVRWVPLKGTRVRDGKDVHLVFFFLLLNNRMACLIFVAFPKIEVPVVHDAVAVCVGWMIAADVR